MFSSVHVHALVEHCSHFLYNSKQKIISHVSATNTSLKKSKQNFLNFPLSILMDDDDDVGVHLSI
jgi:hypothetical protein